MQGSRSVDKESLQLSLVEDCSRSRDRVRHPFKVMFSRSDCFSCHAFCKGDYVLGKVVVLL